MATDFANYAGGFPAPYRGDPGGQHVLINTEPPNTGEHRLLLALITHALRSLIGEGTSLVERGEDQAWIFCSNTQPFSFIYCCECLGFDVSACRGAIRALMKAPKARKQQAMERLLSLVRTQMDVATWEEKAGRPCGSHNLRRLVA